MSDDINEPASVQYNDWHGEVAADHVDLTFIADYITSQPENWWVILFDITVYGGHQVITPYAVPNGTTRDQMQHLVDAGQPVPVTRLPAISYDSGVDDTNPPKAMSMPVISASELVGHGFKRLHIRFRSRSIPHGARLEVVEELTDEDDS